MDIVIDFGHRARAGVVVRVFHVTAGEVRHMGAAHFRVFIVDAGDVGDVDKLRVVLTR